VRTFGSPLSLEIQSPLRRTDFDVVLLTGSSLLYHVYKWIKLPFLFDYLVV
jgi:hypothetical protein